MRCEASSDILAKLSRQLPIALLPALDEGILERVEIAQLSSNRLLVVLAASSGRLETVTLETDNMLAQPKLDELRLLLNERLAGRELSGSKGNLSWAHERSFGSRQIHSSDFSSSRRRNCSIDSPGSERVKISRSKAKYFSFNRNFNIRIWLTMMNFRELLNSLITKRS